MTNPHSGIYAIYDVLAHDIVGGLHIHKHEASALRFFSDVASLPESKIALHPDDYALIRVGFLSHDFRVSDDYAVVMTGTKWAAVQRPAKGYDHPALGKVD